MDKKELIPFKKGKRWGFMDSAGKTIIPCDYSYVYDFKEGLAAVKPKDSFWRRIFGFSKSKWGFIDKLGEIVILCKYDEVESFHDGLAKVELSDLGWGIIDKSGREITPCKYFRIGDFRDDFNQVEISQFIEYNLNNEEYGKNPHDVFYNSMYKAEFLHKCGFIDKSGNEVIPYVYDKVVEFRKDDLALVVYQGKWGVIDRSNKKVVSCIWDGLSLASADVNIELIGVKSNGRWGCINRLEEEVIPCIYEELVVGDDNLIWVRLRGRRFAIDIATV